MSHKKIISILIIIIIALLGYAVYDKFFTTTNSEAQLSEKEIKSLVVKVSKLINVPEELPAVAKIIKAEELMLEQKFYTGSKDGDYLIVFPTAQKAMIYREGENRLINVGPIIVDQPATTTKQAAPVETKATTTVKATTTSSSGN